MQICKRCSIDRVPIMKSGMCADCESVMELDARIKDSEIERLISLERVLPYLIGRDYDIVLARLQGDSQRDIARLVRVGRSTVRKVIARVERAGAQHSRF